jgi:uncharacterized protein RhaS with RHS repeats
MSMRKFFQLLQGRFLSEDPIGYRAGPDFYVYASNNPSNVIDPSGLLQVCCRPAHIGDKMFGLPKGKKPCHCFIKLSDGNTMGGYNKPPGVLQKKLGDEDDKQPKDTPKCSDVPGSECKVRQAFDNYPTYQPYGLAGTSNTVSAQILSDAGISYAFPSCAWGSGVPEVNVPQPFNPYSPFSPWPVPLH